MSEGKCIIFSAPSGAGKTTLVKHLLNKLPVLEFSVSATTREKRSTEKQDEDYYFLNLADFQNKIINDEFLEWEEVYKNQYYGTLKSEIERIWKNGHHVIFDVDVEGGYNLKEHFGSKALAVFVKPPSMKHLRMRLSNRKTETQESLENRIEKAREEMKWDKKFDYILINDNIYKAKREAELVVMEFLRTVE